MKILWLKDQKVGHEKQVLAILKRLQEKIPKMELIEIDVNISFIKNLLLFLLNYYIHEKYNFFLHIHKIICLLNLIERKRRNYF